MFRCVALKNSKKGCSLKCLFYLLFLLFLFSSYAEESTQSVIKAQSENDKGAARSQERISKIVEQKQNIVEKYRETLKEIDETRVHIEQYKKLIADQKEEKISIRNQIYEVEDTDKKIIPLMLEMLKSMEKFVQLDIPFLKGERRKRVQDLKTIMDRSDVTTAEKYRRILEAYTIENAYGRSVEVYRDLQMVEEKELTVDVLRIGRISLIYQTLDGKKGAYWSKSQNKWIKLPSKYNKAVAVGIKVAREHAAPNFVITMVKGAVSRAFSLMEKVTLEETKEEISDSENTSEETKNEKESNEEIKAEGKGNKEEDIEKTDKAEINNEKADTDNVEVDKPSESGGESP